MELWGICRTFAVRNRPGWFGLSWGVVGGGLVWVIGLGGWFWVDGFISDFANELLNS